MKKKIILLTFQDNIFTIPLIKQLSKKEAINIQSIIFLKSKNIINKNLKTILLLNFKDLAELFLKKIINFFNKKDYFNNSEIFFSKSINNKQTIGYINKFDTDLVVCINCPQILEETTIKLIQKPIVNFHPGDLPRYRGVFIPYFILKEKKKEACITFHKIDKFIDKGIIYDKLFIPISKKNNIFEIYKKIFLSNKSKEFIINSILNFNNYENKLSIKEKSFYYSYPSYKEILKFRLRFF